MEETNVRPVTSMDIVVISASEIEERLQRQVNSAAAIAKKMRDGDYVPEVLIQLYPMKLSETFYPIFVILSKDAVIPGTTQLCSHLQYVFQYYMYSGSDQKNLRNNDGPRDLGLCDDTRKSFADAMVPRIEKDDRVRFIIDPSRAIHSLVNRDRGQLPRFATNILKVERNDKDCLYTVERVPSARTGGEWSLGAEGEWLLSAGCSRKEEL